MHSREWFELKELLIIGPWRQNSGPANVIRALKNASDDSISFIENEKGIKKVAEAVIKTLFSKSVVVSPASPYGCRCLKIAKRFGKKTGLLMHGCISYESGINNIVPTSQDLECETDTLSLCDVIIGVSERYAEWLKEYYPQYKSKITFANNGFELHYREKKPKDPFSVAVIGGNTPIKCTSYVYQAVEYLHKNVDRRYKLLIFGGIKESGDCIVENEFTLIKGFLDHDELLEQLDSIGIVVVNSVVESFSLAAADTLECGCNLLVSRNVGFISVAEFGENEIIKNYSDYKEIAKKIDAVRITGNNQRIISSINQELVTPASQLTRILSIMRSPQI